MLVWVPGDSAVSRPGAAVGVGLPGLLHAQLCFLLGTGFSRRGGGGVTVGLGDLRGLFQP